jgi:osmotically-inducible protein OsmY
MLLDKVREAKAEARTLRYPVFSQNDKNLANLAKDEKETPNQPITLAVASNFTEPEDEMTMSDSSLQQAVADELQWEPSVNAAHIGVTAKNGVVTLTGDVSSYAEKWAAERAAGRVIGVKGVAEEIKVRYPFDKVDDTDIAQKALQVLSWDIEVPASKVMVKVENGWVTLTGTVDWHFQRSAAEADVRKLKGVIGVANDIVIKPSVQASDVRAKIQAAFERNADIEDDDITVTVDGGKVTLSGHVDTWSQDSLAVDTAWAAPGVTNVDDRLTVA